MLFLLAAAALVAIVSCQFAPPKLNIKSDEHGLIAVTSSPPDTIKSEEDESGAVTSSPTDMSMANSPAINGHVPMECVPATCYERCWKRDARPVNQSEVSQPDLCSCSHDCVAFGECCLDFFSRCLGGTSLPDMLSHVETIGNVHVMLDRVMSQRKDRDSIPGDLWQSMYLYRQCKKVNIEGEKHPQFFWMISDCPESDHQEGAAMNEVARKCSRTLSDPLARVPVSLKTYPAVVFRNTFCAQCYSIPKDGTVTWVTKAKCPTLGRPLTYEQFLARLSASQCTMFSTPPGGAPPRSCTPDNSFSTCSLYEPDSSTLRNTSLLCRAHSQPVLTSNGFSVNSDCTLCSSNKSVSVRGCVPSKTFEFYNVSILGCTYSYNLSCDDSCTGHVYNHQAKCRCDAKCLLFGNCCFDYVKRCLGEKYDLLEIVANASIIADVIEQTEQGLKNDNTSTDLHLINLYLHYKKCVGIRTRQREEMIWMIGKCPTNQTHALCEGPDSAPASFRHDAGVVFRNIYCGMCHGIATEDLVAWEVDRSLPPQFIVPTGAVHCSREDSNLREVDERNSTELLCGAYRYGIHVDTDVDVKNPHCADLHNQVMKCSPRSDSTGEFIPNLNGGGLSVLFNFKEDGLSFKTLNGKYLVGEAKCGPQEVYDHFIHSCKHLLCLPGTVARNGSCISNGTWFADGSLQIFPNGSHIYILQTYFQTDDPVEVTDIRNATITMFDNYSNVQVLNIVLSNLTTLPEFLPTPIIMNTMELKNLMITFSHFGTIEQNLQMVADTLKPMMIQQVGGIRDMTLQNYDEYSNLFCPRAAVLNLHNVTIAIIHETQYANDSDKLYPLENIAFLRNVLHEHSAVYRVYVCGLPLTCHPVMYNLSDFKQENNSLKSLHFDWIIKNGSFFISEDVVYACHNFTHSGPKNRQFFTLDNTQNILTYVTTGISLVSLLVTLLVYAVLPVLRNLPGRLIMSLSASLILAQSLLLLLLLLPVPTGVWCTALAIAVHFSWLSTFTWMTSLSVNIALGFSGTTGAHQRNIATTHLKYCTFALGIPAVVVMTSTLLDLLEVPGIVIGYGKHGLCWITNPRASLLLFGVPIALVLLVNIVAFSITFYNIDKSWRLSKDLESTRKDKNKAVVYVKLFIIMGLSWSSCFAAAYADINILWYLFILLNGLQGFHIFLSSICNARVQKLLSVKLACRKLQSTSSTPTTSTRY